MLHSILPSTVQFPSEQFPLAQLPLATSIVAADPTGLEWLLLIAAPIVFLVLYLVCLFAVAVFGPTVMKNNKTGGATYLLGRPPVWRLGFALWRCWRWLVRLWSSSGPVTRAVWGRARLFRSLFLAGRGSTLSSSCRFR